MIGLQGRIAAIQRIVIGLQAALIAMQKHDIVMHGGVFTMQRRDIAIQKRNVGLNAPFAPPPRFCMAISAGKTWGFLRRVWVWLLYVCCITRFEPQITQIEQITLIFRCLQA